MNKVTTIHLHGKAFQMEEAGYNALKKYLDDAGTKLADNPDKDEIMQDLEDAIGEKCNAYLNPHKNVLTQSEIEHVIAEMGPVSSTGDTSNTEHTTPQGQSDAKKSTTGSPKRLYKIKEGAMIFGLCNGIAAYFDIDVTLVRIVCVLLTILTGGGWIAAYIIVSLIVPYANTGAEHAAAYGTPFNAQELINQAKKNYTDMKDGREWKKEWRENKKKWKREMRQNMQYAKQNWNTNYDYTYHHHQRNNFWDTVTAIIWFTCIWIVLVFLYHHFTGVHHMLDIFMTKFLTLWYRFLYWLQIHLS